MTVHTTSDARSGLNSVLKRFREKGITAEPLVFGSHRKPEAVVVPFELFERLLPALEEVLLADKVRERLDDPRRASPSTMSLELSVSIRARSECPPSLDFDQA